MTPAPGTKPGKGPTGGKPAGGAGVPSAGTSADAPCTTPGAPIVVGQDGAFSGVIGQALGLARVGAAVWAKEVNARGGIQCHPVQLFQTDNASDPAKTASNVQDLIQSKKAVTLIGAASPITFASVLSVLNRFKVPVLAGDAVDKGWFSNPLAFPQGTAAVPLFAGVVKEMREISGNKKYGMIYCVEATACSDLGAASKPGGEIPTLAGVDSVYVQAASITQSDYTAECQNAKNAGVQLLVMALEGASVQRLVRSCMSIGYTDWIYSAIGIAVNVALSEDANVAKFAGYLGATTQPFTAIDQPAVKEFRAAMAKYAPGSPVDGSALYAWAGGKMLEKALALVPGSRDKPITSEMILQGMHAMKNETLNGLVAPLTFVKDKPAVAGRCYFIVSLEGGKFGDPFNGKKRCL